MARDARIVPGDGDSRHGTVNGYSNLGCRCEICRRANTEAQRRRRERPDVRAADTAKRKARYALKRAERIASGWVPPEDRPPPEEPEPRELRPCGTYAGWHRHRRAGEDPCEGCEEAKRAYNRTQSYARQGAREREPLAPDDPRHGTMNAYNNYRCRCDACRQENAFRSAERRNRQRRK